MTCPPAPFDNPKSPRHHLRLVYSPLERIQHLPIPPKLPRIFIIEDEQQVQLYARWVVINLTTYSNIVKAVDRWQFIIIIIICMEYVSQYINIISRTYYHV